MNSVKKLDVINRLAIVGKSGRGHLNIIQKTGLCRKKRKCHLTR